MTAEATCTLEPPSPANSDADCSVRDLVARARSGDRQAWDALVERYAPLIWSICRRHRLGQADADDVGWLSTTTRRECLRVLSAAQGPHATIYALDVESLPDQQAGTADQELLAAERHAALRAAFTQLPPNGQQLLALLTADPPTPYADISAQLGIPVGSIGPTRSRYLDKIRRHPAIAALINT
jgi:DNA-directed RNA polymerase specialized sigma24 family protein